MQILLQERMRRAQRTGRRIIVVMDQGSPHHAEALARYLEDVKEQSEVFWLPRYSPELNRIERLWKRLKASRMTNVLWQSFGAFTSHIGAALAQLALHPDFTLSLATPTLQGTRQRNTLVATWYGIPFFYRQPTVVYQNGCNETHRPAFTLPSYGGLVIDSVPGTEQSLRHEAIGRDQVYRCNQIPAVVLGPPDLDKPNWDQRL